MKLFLNCLLVILFSIESLADCIVGAVKFLENESSTVGCTTWTCKNSAMVKSELGGEDCTLKQEQVSAAFKAACKVTAGSVEIFVKDQAKLRKSADCNSCKCYKNTIICDDKICGIDKTSKCKRIIEAGDYVFFPGKNQSCSGLGVCAMFVECVRTDGFSYQGYIYCPANGNKCPDKDECRATQYEPIENPIVNATKSNGMDALVDTKESEQ